MSEVEKLSSNQVDLDPHGNMESDMSAIIRQLMTEDVEFLRPIIEEWVRDSSTGDIMQDEVNDIELKLRQSLTGEIADRQYLVAEYAGLIVGVMGVASPSELMKQYARSDNPVEIINAFVSSDSRGSGMGTQLLESAFGLARFVGASEIMVNSGPRYRDTAWEFYDKKFDGRLTILKDYYGQGLDAPVWSKLL